MAVYEAFNAIHHVIRHVTTFILRMINRDQQRSSTSTLLA